MSLHWPAATGYNLNLTTTGADQIIEGPNPDRTCIVLPSTSFNYNYALGVVTKINGPQVGPAVDGFVLTRDAIGDLITQELHVQAAAGKVITLLIGTNAELAAQRSRDRLAQAKRWRTQRGYLPNLAVPLVDTVLLGPDPARTSLAIPCTGLGLAWAIGQPATSTGPAIGPDNNGFQLTRDMIGDLITQEVHLLADSAGTVNLLVGTGYLER